MADLNQVAAFVETVRRGSFAEAARALELPRSTVSARVQGLEAALGVRLLKRTTRRMSLTGEGRAYFDEVAPAIDALHAADSGVRNTGGPLTGVVRLTAPSDYPHSILTTAVASFRELHPRVRIDVSLTNQTLDFVKDGVDLAIRGGRAGGAGLVSFRLPDLPFGLFASPRYFERRGRPRTMSDLETHDFLLFRGREQRHLLGLPKSVEAAARRAVSSVSSDSMGFLKQLALEGQGLTVLPRHLCKEELASGVLVLLFPDFRGVEQQGTFLVFPSLKDIPARVRAFADHLKANATAQGPAPLIARSR